VVHASRLRRTASAKSLTSVAKTAFRRMVYVALPRAMRRHRIFAHERLEIHAAHACNLTCESCSHFSNGGHRGIVSLQDAEARMKSWNGRIEPRTFRILGGEPTLNPRLAEFVYLTRQCWPRAKITLVTNGFLLKRHPTLPVALEACDVDLSVSVHGRSIDYANKLEEVAELLQSWRDRHKLSIEFADSYSDWTRRHEGVGQHVRPYDDRDPLKSWAGCPAKECHQLFRRRLWKCPSIAYLKLHKEKYQNLDAAWNPYLAYEGLDPSCSDEELEAFLLKKEEPICGMCPTNRVKFDKPCPI
jgi:radical SAM family protein